MKYVHCPYCTSQQEVNHDDGYGYGDQTYTQQCFNCLEIFEFTTDISYTYDVRKRGEWDA